MPDSKKITIEFRATADLAAAKEAEEAIKKVTDAAKGDGAASESPVAAGMDAVKESADAATAAVNQTEAAIDKASVEAERFARVKDQLWLTELREDMRSEMPLLSLHIEDEQVEMMEQAAAAMRDVADATNEAAEAETKSNEADALGKVERQQKLQTLTLLGAGLKKVGNDIQQVSKEFEAIDPHLAKNIQQVGEATSAVGTLSSAIAGGMVVGGPWGAALAGAGAGAAILAKSYIDAEKDIAEATAKIDAQVDKVREKNRQLGAEAGAQRWKEWVDGWDDVSAAIARNNTVIDQQLRVQRELKDLAVQNAETDATLRKAKIDSDPALSDADKTRQKAAIDQELAAIKKVRSGEKLDERVEDADRARDDSQAELAKARELQSVTHEAAEARRREVEDFDRQALERKQAEERAQALQQTAKPSPLREWFKAGFGGYGWKGVADPMAVYDEAQAQREQIENEIERSKGASYQSPREAKREEDVRAQLEASKKTLDQLDEEVKRLESQTNALGAKAAAERQIADARKGQLDTSFDVATETRSVTTDAAARKQEETARKKKEQEEQKARRETEKAERERKQSELDDNARGVSDRILGSRNPRARNPILQGIGKDLADGTNERELAKIRADVIANQDKLGAVTTATLKELIGGMQKQAAEIQALKSQAKNLRKK